MWLSQSLRNAGAGAVKKGPATLGEELISNGSFEKLAGDMPAGWTRTYFVGRRNTGCGSRPYRQAIDRDLGRSRAPTRASISMSRWNETRSMNSAAGSRPRTCPVEGAAQCYSLQGIPTRRVSKGVKGTNDWTQVKVRFETYEDESVRINCLFGGWGTVHRQGVVGRRQSPQGRV